MPIQRGDRKNFPHTEEFYYFQNEHIAEKKNTLHPLIAKERKKNAAQMKHVTVKKPYTNHIMIHRIIETVHQENVLEN